MALAGCLQRESGCGCCTVEAAGPLFPEDPERARSSITLWGFEGVAVVRDTGGFVAAIAASVEPPDQRTVFSVSCQNHSISFLLWNFKLLKLLNILRQLLRGQQQVF